MNRFKFDSSFVGPALAGILAVQFRNYVCERQGPIRRFAGSPIPAARALPLTGLRNIFGAVNFRAIILTITSTNLINNLNPIRQRTTT